MKYFKGTAPILALLIGCQVLSVSKLSANPYSDLKTAIDDLQTNLKHIDAVAVGKTDLAIPGQNLRVVADQLIALGKSTNFDKDLTTATTGAPSPITTTITSFKTAFNLPPPALGMLQPVDWAGELLTRLNSVILSLNTVSSDLSSNKPDGPTIQTDLTHAGEALTIVAQYTQGPAFFQMVQPQIQMTELKGMPEFISHMSFFGGVITLNPYTIGGSGANGGAPFNLTNNSTTAKFTIQIDYHDRWAWDATTDTNRIVKDGNERARDTQFNFDFHHNPLKYIDFQARSGYVFDQSATNASTIVGSGDFAGEFAIGLRGWQTVSNNCDFVHSINFPEVNVSFVTARGFSQTHTALTVGPSYVASSLVKRADGTGYDRARFLIRGGAAFYDSPVFGTGTMINDNGHNAPKFQQELGWSVETEASYPLGEGSCIGFGARVYQGHYPSPWTVWVGASYSMSNIVSAVKKILP